MEINEQVRELSQVGEKCWVDWKFEEREGDPKPAKVPYMPSGRRASSTDSATWSTYAEVVEAVGSFDGIGIVFTGSLLGIDLDHCISEDGNVSPEIESFIEKASTYTEVSPSGDGLHLYLRLTEPMTLERNRSGNYECYTSKRFFTVSGTPWTVTYPIRTVTPIEAIELLRNLGYPWKKEEIATAPVMTVRNSLEEGEILSLMFAAKNGEKMRALYAGDTSGYGGDESRADAALCASLSFWTSRDRAMIESIWLSSPLGSREKTKNRPDYRNRTIDNAIASTKETYSGGSTVSQAPQTRGETRSKAVVSSFADIQPQPIHWLWPGRIALGKVTLIAGDPGLGKSLTTVTMAAIISKGYKWPLTDSACPVGSVVFLSAEDDPADTIRPRLDAAQADCTRIHVLQAIKEIGADGKPTERMFSLKRDLSTLEELLPTLHDCRLVIIDPVSAYLDGTDSHANADVRGLLAPLAKLAADHDVAIVLVQHLNKNSKESAMYRSMGSIGFIGAARAGYLVTKDRDNPDRRLVMPIKNNLAKDNTGLAYSIMTAGNGAPSIVWELEPVTITADDALALVDLNEDKTSTDWAVTVLETILSKGPVLAVNVQKEIKQAGVTQKELRRAQKVLGIKPKKIGFNEGWEWSLSGHEGVQEAPSKDEGALFDPDDYREYE